MIHAFRIVNYVGESIRIQLNDPWESGFVVKSVDGLGPVKANVNFTEMATRDGGELNSARKNTRNIVFHFAFLESPTIEETRHLSYRYFPIGKMVRVIVENDRGECYTDGVVENNDPDIFNKEEGCSVSILCGNPYFYDIKEQTTAFNGVDPLFEFPFMNDSLEEPLIEFGSIINYKDRTLIYEGEGNPGIVMRIHLIGPVKGLTIYNLDGGDIMKIDEEKIHGAMDRIINPGKYEDYETEENPGGGSTGRPPIVETPVDYIGFGDDIIVNTNVGQKSIKVVRAGIEYDVMSALERPIHWFHLNKGSNTFSYGCTEGVSNVQLKITNKILYEGV